MSYLVYWTNYFHNSLIASHKKFQVGVQMALFSWSKMWEPLNQAWPCLPPVLHRLLCVPLARQHMEEIRMLKYKMSVCRSSWAHCEAKVSQPVLDCQVGVVAVPCHHSVHRCPLQVPVHIHLTLLPPAHPSHSVLALRRSRSSSTTPWLNPCTTCYTSSKPGVKATVDSTFTLQTIWGNLASLDEMDLNGVKHTSVNFTYLCIQMS